MWQIQDPVLIFSVLMLTFLLAPLLAEKLRLPELVLLLIAGIVFGPNGFGFMTRSGAIELFGSIGLLYIMFVAGLETDAHHFRKTAKRSATFGVISFLIPQVLGTLIGMYILDFSFLASVLLASMFASHTLIAYPIASRFGLSKNESVVITVGGTIVTNTLSLLILAVVADSSKGEELGVMFWLTLILGMLILTILIWWLLPIIASWFFRNVPEKGSAQFVFVLGIVCLTAYWSHYAKMEPIIGAFLAGVAFNRLIPSQSTLMNRLVFVGNTFFIPFFLISVGMLINPRALVSSPHGLLVAVTMSVTVIFTKFWAAGLVKRIFKYSKAERNVIFGLSVSQAAATLAAVLVGYELKIFDDDVLNGTIVMILVSCSLGCYFVDRYGKQMVTDSPVVSNDAGNEQRIMVAVSNPQTASKLLDLTFLLRNPAMQNEIFPVTVVNDIKEDDVSENVARGEKILEGCISQAASVEIPLSPGIRVDVNPTDGLLRATKEFRCSQMILGWNGQCSLRTRVFGSVADQLQKSCPTRLLFCRLTSPLNTCKRVVLPLPEMSSRRYDLLQLMQDAKQLTSQISAELHLFIPPDFLDETLKKIHKITPKCRMIVNHIDSWGQQENDFLSFLKASDILLMPMERRESILWSPRFERLTELLSTQYPDINFLLAYPQLPGHDDYLATKADFSGFVSKNNIYGMDLSIRNLGDAVESLIDECFPKSNIDTRSIKVGLFEAFQYHPFELSDNTVMIHTRSESINTSVILVGMSADKYEVAALKEKYNIVIALISPKHDAHNIHLNELANLARRFINAEFTAEVMHASNADEVVNLLKK